MGNIISFVIQLETRNVGVCRPEAAFSSGETWPEGRGGNNRILLTAESTRMATGKLSHQFSKLSLPLTQSLKLDHKFALNWPWITIFKKIHIYTELNFLPKTLKNMSYSTLLSLMLTFGTILWLSQASPARNAGNDVNESKVAESKKTSKERIKGPLTEHFMQWLEKNGYADYDFAYTHMGSQASFGGKTSHSHKINQHPVIFIHGNSDGALDLNLNDAVESNPTTEGWSTSIAYFLQNGYTSSELYAITYGDRQPKNSGHRSMDCDTVIRLRRFVEAVLQYTNASHVDIISHSMGVSLARRIIKGGNMNDGFNECYIGTPIHNKIHTFIGIAGANYGMCLCADEKMANSLPACGKTNGFWAGTCTPINDMLTDCLSPIPTSSLACGTGHQYSQFLQNLNNDSTKEAKVIVSMWSDGDTILGKSNFAWGRMTSIIPNSDRMAMYSGYDHYEVKSKTAKDQFMMVTASHFRR
ncbi:lipase (class 2) domain-containing protein [Ditylenchus destructor]|uniref:Lipase (Class 2) domain-containing protein n=1 Tax=Ditylenchus destructor TaxID=166010 RepID=A0AAD4ND98_9BILA|nr:lipase (class 2) domain-containing protein [Ditylenchus destructor]